MNKLSDFELRSLPGLWRQYDQSARQMGFRAGSCADVENWQNSLRETIVRLLGGKPDFAAEMDVHLIESVNTEVYTRELVVIQTFPGEYLPCYVLIPYNGPRPYKPVIALHGHGTLGARGIVGMAENEQDSQFIRDLNYDYAHQCALRGYLVFAPMLRGFAERMESRPSQPDHDETNPELWESSCKPVAVNALLLGKTLLGLRAWETLRLIDYIRSRPEPMIEGLGGIGLSGGGMVMLFSAALDQRLTCLVISGYLNTFRDSIMAIDHCMCNYVPGIVQYAEMPDIAGLVAPRPLLAESGTSDPIFPTAATQRTLDELRPIYTCFGAEDRLDSDIFDGRHQWSGKKAYDWLAKWL
jgi:hypothetical protein